MVAAPLRRQGIGRVLVRDVDVCLAPERAAVCRHVHEAEVRGHRHVRIGGTDVEAQNVLAPPPVLVAASPLPSREHIPVRVGQEHPLPRATAVDRLVDHGESGRTQPSGHVGDIDVGSAHADKECLVGSHPVRHRRPGPGAVVEAVDPLIRRVAGSRDAGVDVGRRQRDAEQAGGRALSGAGEGGHGFARGNAASR